jgi:sigma-B regulation protein RsbU (phosphoserine phosphatase)
VAAFPRDALDTLLAQQRRTFVTIGSVVFLAASALGWLIANRLTGRLATISRAARDLQKGSFGNLTELEQFSGQSDEIARLGQVVHDMGKEVQNREAILEGEVRKRTEELALRNEALAASQAMIRGELELAKRLQLGILPSRFPSCGGYEGSARVRMQQQMGGDFYDFIPRADGSVAVVVADVSGKGIAAAFFMAMARTSLAEQLTQGLGIEECLSRSNEVLCQSNPLNLFVTVFVALIEPNSGRVCYANAGHNPPVHLFPQGDPQLLPMRGELALGVMEGVRYSLDTLHLKPGEALLTYTDGITEAFDDEGRAYGETRLLQWARLLDHQASAEQSLTSLLNDVDSFQDAANQSDDITMALIRRLPNV